MENGKWNKRAVLSRNRKNDARAPLTGYGNLAAPRATTYWGWLVKAVVSSPSSCHYAFACQGQARSASLRSCALRL